MLSSTFTVYQQPNRDMFTPTTARPPNTLLLHHPSRPRAVLSAQYGVPSHTQYWHSQAGHYGVDIKLICLQFVPPAAAAFSAAIFASIFLLASMIIWSLLFCSNDCLSSRFELQAPVLGALLVAAPASSEGALASFSFKLYLVIRSG